MIRYISKNKQLFLLPGIIYGEIEEVIKFLDTNTIIGFDTETTGFSVIDDNVLCYQIGNRNDQFVIDHSSYPLQQFKKYFEDSSKTWLFQNFKFDGRFLIKYGVHVWSMKVFDTFLAECVLNTGLKNVGLGLDDIVWKYCNFKLDKTVRGQINALGLTTRVIKYAAEDVEYLEDVMNEQIKKLKELNLENVMNLENEVVKVFTYMEYHGVKLNVDRWKEVIKTVDIEVDKLIKSLEYI